MSNFTPESAGIMRILGMGAAEIDIPQRYAMFDDVMTYFGTDFSSARKQILKILSKSSNRDGLEAVWRYVTLQNEKKKVIQSINPAEFQDDISNELKEGILTMKNMKRVEEDMKRREQRKQRTMRKDDQPDENDSILKDALNVKTIKEKFDQVKEINQMLQQYG